MLIDFGSSIFEKQRHISKYKRVGNPAYGSKNRLIGEALCLKDDIESLLYMVMHLYTGEIPGYPVDDVSESVFINDRVNKSLCEWIDYY